MVTSMANQPSKKAPAQDPGDGIPMNKTKPTTIIIVIGAVALVLGVTAFSMSGGKKQKAENKAAAAAAAQPTDNMTAEERKLHLEITRKSLEKFEEVKAAEAQKKKAADEAAKAKAAEEEEKSNVAAAPAGGGAPVKKKTSGAAAKKTASDLDSLGSDIAGKLGGK